MSIGKSAENRGDATYLERMAILGEMFAEASHEINNLLGAACAYVELETERRRRDGDSLSYLEAVMHLARLAGDLATNVLHFSSPASGGVGDIEEAVSAVIGLFGYRTRTGIDFLTELPRPLPPVSMPSGNLLLALANLVKNALEALDDATNGTVKISASHVGGDVVLRIWNSGPGIPADVLSKLFTRHFTTKAGGKGSGLGLSIAQRLAHEARGTLTGANALVGGVEFILTLPVASAVVEKPPAETPLGRPSSTPLRGRRILIVDDDDSIRGVMELVLSQMDGCDVGTCASGEEALRRLESERFDAVVLDLRMPGLSGQSTYERMSPELRKRVVFVTGDALRSTTSDFLSLSRQPALIKPVAHAELVEAIRRVAQPRTRRHK